MSTAVLLLLICFGVEILAEHTVGADMSGTHWRYDEKLHN